MKFKIGFMGSDFNSLYFSKPILSLVYYKKISKGAYIIINRRVAAMISDIKWWLNLILVIFNTYLWLSLKWIVLHSAWL